MFQPQFAAQIKSGAKRQTIRPVPTRMPRVGDPESWRQWSGLPYRSKQIELAKVELTAVVPFKIVGGYEFYQDGQKIMSPWLCEEIAGKDGFATMEDMMNWFETNHGLPFTGILIHAKDLNPATLPWPPGMGNVRREFIP